MKLVKKYFLRLFIISTFILLLVGCDQTTKQVAHKELKNRANTEIAGIVKFQYVENEGGMLSLGNDFPQQIKFTIFILIVSVFLLILFLYLIKKNQEAIIKQFALILILCGGLGNLIDRISNSGKVIDFIRLDLPWINNAVFNIADFYVTIGIIFLLIGTITKNKLTMSK
jgi:signal peptidase II